jgi:transposase-like protein
VRKFFRTLLKGLMSVPRVIITDKLVSDRAAKHEVLPGCPPSAIPPSHQPRREFPPTDR